ncbi:MAG: hypothetical protein AB1798_10345 [Spirochaetota bacterium]
MTVQDPEILKVITKLGEHYRNNINNVYIHKLLLRLDISSSNWELIANLTQASNLILSHEYRFDELYERILAIAQFVYRARKNLLPNLKSSLSGWTAPFASKTSPGGDREKLLRDIAISNFPSNVGILSDLVHELYMKTAEYDKKQHHPKPPVYEKMPELKEIGKLLVES